MKIDNIFLLMSEKNITAKELSKQTGISPGNISDWKNGRSSPKTEALLKIANYFGVSVDYLLGKSKLKNTDNLGKGVKIPVLGTVKAGIPIEAIEEILDYEEITSHMASTGEFFALKINGDSMNPRFNEGDIVIVRKQSDADNGDIVVALVNGEDATIKKLKKTEQGIMLIPFNSNYEPIFYDNFEISNKPVSIVGKVVELRAKF